MPSRRDPRWAAEHNELRLAADRRDQRHQCEGRSSREAEPVGCAARGRRDVMTRQANGAAGGIGLAHGFTPASFRNAASPASDTLTHRGSTVVSAS